MNMKEYWFDQLREIEEFQLIANIDDEQLENINEALNTLIDDQFIQTATEKGIATREKMLNITPFADDTLDTRRFRVLNRWNNKLPYTYAVLLEKLNELVGENNYAALLDHLNYLLKIQCQLEDDQLVGEIEYIVKTMKPANIVFMLEIIKQLKNASLKIGAVLQTGTEMRIYPIFSDELTGSKEMKLISYYKQGTYLSVYPKII